MVSSHRILLSISYLFIQVEGTIYEILWELIVNNYLQIDSMRLMSLLLVTYKFLIKIKSNTTPIAGNRSQKLAIDTIMKTPTISMKIYKQIQKLFSKCIRIMEHLPPKHLGKLLEAWNRQHWYLLQICSVFDPRDSCWKST